MSVLFITAFLITFSLSKQTTNTNKILKTEFETHWKKWKSDNKRIYNSISEELTRKAIFLSNLKKINELNSQRIDPDDAVFGLNAFSDLKPEEFSRRFNKINLKLLKLKQRNHYKLPVPSGEVPTQYSACLQDMLLDKNSSNEIDLCGGIVIDQGDCGSCYAISNAHELQLKYANLTLTQRGKIEYEMFSPQQLMDCTENSYYCEGGTADEPLMSSHYVVFEKDYPYISYSNTLINNSCVHDKLTPMKVSFSLFDSAQNFEILKRITYYYGSFVTSVKASSDWSYYHSGIYSHSCTKNVVTNHVIEIVGYGNHNGKEYLIARNSWGKNWGIDGFIKISAKSLCGIGGDDGGIYPVSLIQHTDFSDVPKGKYGKKSYKQEVQPKLYNGTDKYDIYEQFPDSSGDSFIDIIISFIVTIPLVVGLISWAICAIVILILSCVFYLNKN
ncbi:cysteine protease, putative [Entamoeba dispar SAW760]|uniref:Cysteine protease, putative n=1 Tax=Entamoeba dispar (strain ATCC PRA-260 / SAW760) TaxID=370354 RepID=B0ERM4_ENTDS|nr:cysteine protease, putative [Entamoeba dispar SAW760]EDR22828.1 cysteine protease, putative [Entamoeba dispar SAW760]|eukprot:EDR22828.1 cysteine protease, putative [Entamoeba dispar SAW760]